MVSLNKKRVTEHVYTAEGAIASKISKEEQLVRSVLSCLLWEDIAYEDGTTVASRIQKLVHENKPEFVSKLAVHARHKTHLRHVPLLLVRELIRHKVQIPGLVRKTISEVISRPDEITELMALYWKDGRTPIASQLKKGLSDAFNKFSEYSLAKYLGEGKGISLKDAMFLSHAKPVDVDKSLPKYTKKERSIYKNGERQVDVEKTDRVPTQRPSGFSKKEVLFYKLSSNKLKTPETWEVLLSTGGDKKEVFEKLMTEGKLGGLAFIRNLRLMKEVGVQKSVVSNYANTAVFDKVLPFRFITAASAVPGWEDVVETTMLRCLEKTEKLPGKTILVLDESGSMDQRLSRKSDLSRRHASMALAILAREICDEVAIYATASEVMQIPPRRGFAISGYVDGIKHQLGRNGIYLKKTMDFILGNEKTADRIIVFTDEQDCSHSQEESPEKAVAFGKHNYIINVSTEENGIAYKKFTHINGWSEHVLNFIRLSEGGITNFLD